MFRRVLSAVLCALFFSSTYAGWKRPTAYGALLVGGGVLAVTYLQSHAQAKRTRYNDAQLEQFRQFCLQYPKANIAVVTDLHDVALDRLPYCGDIARAWQLPKLQLCKFIGRTSIFGTRMLLSKITRRVRRPHIELCALDGVAQDQDIEHLLAVISPFEPNRTMQHVFASCKYPVFACSNIGQQSYAHLQAQYQDMFLTFRGAQMATRQNNFIQKNDAHAFELLAEIIETETGSKPDAILFIDDQYSNITRCATTLGARNIQVFGYHFDHDAAVFERKTQRFLLKP